MSTPATIATMLDYCLDDDWNKCPIPDFLRWPPDVFAVAAAILYQSGAYVHVVKKWPPEKNGVRDSAQWIARIREIADEWRKAASSGATCDPPAAVSEWWNLLKAHAGQEVVKCGSLTVVCDTLLQLLAVADEASRGAGFVSFKDSVDPFLAMTDEHLLMSLPSRATETPLPSTLCKFIHPSRLVVLPKARTPQSGITIRSVSHHLTLVFPCGVTPVWEKISWRHRKHDHGINLLLIPWPKVMLPAQFRPVATDSLGPASEMLVRKHGFFEFVPQQRTPDAALAEVKDIYRRALAKAGQIDGVVFPEMALSPAEFKAITDSSGLVADAFDGFVVSGIYEAPHDFLPADNYAAIQFAKPRVELYPHYHKHHRWFLEENQIRRYGLGYHLDPEMKWWEFTSLKHRVMHFVSIYGWLTFTVLICEDLVRPDPAAELVRSIGPNLLIALLQDGPQRANRWPARSAAVLSDDPGCSVLTVTGLGLTQLGLPPAGKSQSRAIAMWREPGTSDIQEIELPVNSDAVVLSLTRRYESQWTADGRDDFEATGCVRLSGVHFV